MAREVINNIAIEREVKVGDVFPEDYFGSFNVDGRGLRLIKDMRRRAEDLATFISTDVTDDAEEYRIICKLQEVMMIFNQYIARKHRTVV
ncbi:MAG: hypothetical protein ACXABY_09485 [Candidatus Thorarchaeota archaeon]|jgi:hypothetical protein